MAQKGFAGVGVRLGREVVVARDDAVADVLEHLQRVLRPQARSVALVEDLHQLAELAKRDLAGAARAGTVAADGAQRLGVGLGEADVLGADLLEPEVR